MLPTHVPVLWDQHKGMSEASRRRSWPCGYTVRLEVLYDCDDPPEAATDGDTYTPVSEPDGLGECVPADCSILEHAAALILADALQRLPTADEAQAVGLRIVQHLIQQITWGNRGQGAELHLGTVLDWHRAMLDRVE